MVKQNYTDPWKETIDENGSAMYFDEESTVDMAASDDGSRFDGIKMWRLDEHPNKARRRKERLGIWSLLGFFAAMLLFVIPMSLRKKQVVLEEPEPIQATEKNLSVYCNGKKSYDLKEWLKEDTSDSSKLCDPQFHPESREANMEKPVKVFLMMGEGNMVGAGTTYGTGTPGTLDYTVKEKKRFIHLVDDDKEWQARPDVRYVAVQNDFEVKRNEWLSVYEEHQHFGPELQFGYVMGELHDEPVLLLKSCTGHQSLGGDLLPPGSKRFVFGDYVYAGYGESPRRWALGSVPLREKWHAGSAYNQEISNIKKVLGSIQNYYPGASSYEIAGVVFWHGDSDRRDPAYASMYRSNLRNFISNVRRDLDAPHAKFAVATLGQGGTTMSGDSLEILNAQESVGKFFPNFEVATMDIRKSWKTSYLPGFHGDESMRDVAHYGRNAETVMEVGNALGLGMARLLQSKHGKTT